MKQIITLIFAVTVARTNAAPQFITFKEGRLGVNFGGYHAGVGLGGILGGGAGGGLFAEAGTPFGQEARAGLGGAVDSNGGTGGGLYAGATAGGNIKASAGLAGGVTAEKSAGVGYASAQAGDHVASSGLGGDASVGGASGFSFSGTKSFGGSSGVIKEVEVAVQPVEVQPVQKKVQAEFNLDVSNEVKPLPLSPVAQSEVAAKSEVQADVNVEAVAPPVLVKEVYIQPQPVVEKQVIHTHYKVRRPHFRKTAYIGGYLGSGAGFDAPPPPPPVPVVYKTVQPVIEKRIDIGAETAASAGAAVSAGAVASAGATADTNAQGGGAGHVGYRKEVSFQSNPTFFADIFNIPISTLKAVGNFLGNAAGSTNISVQKSASVQAGGYGQIY